MGFPLLPRRQRRRPTTSVSRNRRAYGPRLEPLENRLLPSLTPHLLKDIDVQRAGSSPAAFVDIGGVAYFSATDPVHGRELWRSNGTAAGTRIVKDINPGGAGSYPYDLTNVNGTLFFEAFDGSNGPQLWRSNGTAAGTVLVKDIAGREDLDLTRFYDFTNVNGTLFFDTEKFNSNSSLTLQLWRSDGTSSGTQVVLLCLDLDAS